MIGFISLSLSPFDSLSPLQRINLPLFYSEGFCVTTAASKTPTTIMMATERKISYLAAIQWHHLNLQIYGVRTKEKENERERERERERKLKKVVPCLWLEKPKVFRLFLKEYKNSHAFLVLLPLQLFAPPSNVSSPTLTTEGRPPHIYKRTSCCCCCYRR